MIAGLLNGFIRCQLGIAKRTREAVVVFTAQQFCVDISIQTERVVVKGEKEQEGDNAGQRILDCVTR